MLEIVSKNINKYKSLKILLRKLRVSQKDVYAIGDSYTDIEMVKNFNGYAVGNSIEEIKKVSKEVVSNVSELIEKIS